MLVHKGVKGGYISSYLLSFEFLEHTKLESIQVDYNGDRKGFHEEVRQRFSLEFTSTLVRMFFP